MLLRYALRCLAAACLLSGAGQPAVAQNLDPSYVPTVLKRTNVGYVVRAMLRQPDGKILVGGLFTFLNGMPAGHLLRLNADGTLDAPFMARLGRGFDGQIQALALQPDGKILVGGGGEMNYAGQLLTRQLARLNADGSPDASFNVGGAGIEGEYINTLHSVMLPTDVGLFAQNVRSLTVQPDGKILVGGQRIGTYNGQPVGNLFRLNANGSLDTGFSSPAVNGASNDSYIIESLLAQADGKIVVGGSFRTPTANKLARLNPDGSLDQAFGPGTGPGGTVRALALQPDGKILVGGLFTSFNGQSAKGLVRLHTDGSRDNAFQIGGGATGPANSTIGVFNINLQADGSALLSGNFTAFDGAARGGMAKVSATGGLATGFAAGSSADGTVYNLLSLPDGSYLAGGAFHTCNGVARTGLARLSATNQTVDAAFNPVMHMSGFIQQALQLSSGKLLVEGLFDEFNAQPVTGALHLVGPSGSYEGAVPVAVNGINYLQLDGSIYVANNVTIGGVSYHQLQHLLPTGALDPRFAPVRFAADGYAGYLHSLQVEPGTGTIWVTGNFTRVNGQPRHQLARLHPDGSLYPVPPIMPWSAATIFSRSPTLEGMTAGKPLVCWADARGEHIVRLLPDGTVDNTFTLNLNTALGANEPYQFCVLPNGQLLFAGSFSRFAGQATPNGMVRLTTTGQPDPTFVAAQHLDMLWVQPNGNLLGITAAQRSCYGPGDQLVRLLANGSTDTGFEPVSIPQHVYYQGGLQTAITQADGKILLAGQLFTVAGQVRVGLALLDPALAAAPRAGTTVSLNAYPNPAQQSLTLRLPAATGTAQSVELFDLQGQLVHRWEVPARQQEATFPLSDLNAGIYLLRANTPQGTMRQRVMVTR